MLIKFRILTWRLLLSHCLFLFLKIWNYFDSYYYYINSPLLIFFFQHSFGNWLLMIYFDNFNNLYLDTRLFIKEQYKFVYDTLEEFVVCGTSWFPVAELSQRLKQKSIKNPITKMNEYQREYQQICKQTPRFTIGDCAGGHRADNREKNRDVLVVPREFQLSCCSTCAIGKASTNSFSTNQSPPLLQRTTFDRTSPAFRATVSRITSTLSLWM